MREYLMPIFVVTALALAGCNKSKSPEDVSKDVQGGAEGEQRGGEERRTRAKRARQIVRQGQ